MACLHLMKLVDRNTMATVSHENKNKKHHLVIVIRHTAPQFILWYLLVLLQQIAENYNTLCKDTNKQTHYQTSSYLSLMPRQ